MSRQYPTQEALIPVGIHPASTPENQMQPRVK